MKTEKENFEIANDLHFWDACMDFMDGIKTATTNPLKTVGDRMRLISDLEKNGFTISKIKNFKKSKDEITVTVSEQAIVEVLNFDKNNSWVRWHFLDFSDNGNINLPKGKNYKIKRRIGDKVILETY